MDFVQPQGIRGAVFRLLGDALRGRVEPLAAALDRRPTPGVLETGRRDAGPRAAHLGDALFEGPGDHGEGEGAYSAARELLSDLWAVVAEEAAAAAPAAGAWVRGAFFRVLARAARHRRPGDS